MKVTQYLLICVVIIAMLTGIVSAKTPAYGVGNMDGYPFDEWNLATDFWGDMINADTNTVYAKAYVRYDCDTETVYVLVISEGPPGPLLLMDTGTSASINNVNVYTGFSGFDGTPPDILWDEYSNPYAFGYEASFPLAPGSYSSFVIESLFYDPDLPLPFASGVTVDEPLTITCGAIPSPEFPSAFLPATMIIGFLGAVLLLQRTREH
jgi:hypothetical protein